MKAAFSILAFMFFFIPLSVNFTSLALLQQIYLLVLHLPNQRSKGKVPV